MTFVMCKLDWNDLTELVAHWRNEASVANGMGDTYGDYAEHAMDRAAYFQKKLDEWEQK